MTALGLPVSDGRAAVRRRLLMCRPDHFAVEYRINPWMHPEVPVDRGLAQVQWQHLHDTYAALGHRVEVVEPTPGSPDMVFAANSAVVIDDRVLVARFHDAERQGEEAGYLAWFEAQGFAACRQADHVMEGEGDVVVVGDVLIAATGFRTELAAHAELARFFEREVVTVTLVDPRFYHLDTALFALGDGRVAWYPGAFSELSQQVIRRRWPDALVADEADALAMGLNAFSDGRHLVVSARAERLADRLAGEGFVPVLVDMSELHKSGGSVKCCTLEVR